MKLKRIISVIIAVGIVGAMCSCGDTKISKNILTAEMLDKTIDATDISKKIEITWMGVPYNGSAKEGTYAEKLIEERFNVEIKPIFMDQTDFNDKKTMMMTNGEIPDIVYELDPVNVYEDATQGLIAEIPYEIVKKYAPSLYANLNKEAKNAWLYSNVNGQNFGIPNLNYANGYPRNGLWRTDWLRNVGIEKTPETIEEMHDALLKFVTEDPDGNGKNDTFGMGGDIANWHTMFTEIFGAYGVTPFNWMEKDGKIVYGGFMPGTKAALETLAQWYKEGIIHPDFITDNVFSTGKTKFTNGTVGYINQHGGYFDLTNSNSLPNTMKQINSNAEIEVAKLVKGPEGNSGTQAWGKPCHVISFGKQVGEDPEKMARILYIFETLMTDGELSQKIRIGDENKHWAFNDISKGFGGGFKFIAPYDDANRLAAECLSDSFGAVSFFAPFADTYESYEAHMNADKLETYIQYSDRNLALTDAFGKPDVLPSASEYFADLRTKQINLMVEIIKGNKSVSEYDKFREQWDANGGKQLEAEAVEMGETLTAIYDALDAE